MLPRQMFRAAISAAVVLSMSAASAQFYGNNCSSCGPVATAAVSCAPVQTMCYQNVPVTTYRREKQTVREPYYRTTYEDREVTVMRPVTTQREVEIPTVSYRTVTEYRTVNRDMGRWITRYTPVQKCSPCQVDPRPGLIGWLNRTGYSFRTAFRPNYYTSRQYVPNMMTCTVPVNRQVAVQGTRRVTVNETRMVAERKTERVAVQKLDYRERVVTVMKPQVAYRTVPIGSQLAYGYGGYGYGAATAFAPTIIDSRTALAPEADPNFTEGSPRSAQADERAPFVEDNADRPVQRSSHSRELENDNDLQPLDFENLGTSNDRKQLLIPATYTQPASQPSKADAAPAASGWAATSRKTAMRSASQSAAGSSKVTMTQKSEK